VTRERKALPSFGEKRGQSSFAEPAFRTLVDFYGEKNETLRPREGLKRLGSRERRGVRGFMLIREGGIFGGIGRGLRHRLGKIRCEGGQEMFVW